MGEQNTIADVLPATVLSQFSLTWWQSNNWGLGSNTYIGIYAALGISSALFTFLLGLATVWFGTAAARTLHNMALTQVIQAPMTYFDQTPLGRIMNRFSKDTDNLDSRLNDSLRMALATVAQSAYPLSPLSTRVRPARLAVLALRLAFRSFAPGYSFLHPVFHTVAAAVIMISIVYPYFLIPVAAVAYLFVTTSNFCEFRTGKHVRLHLANARTTRFQIAHPRAPSSDTMRLCDPSFSHGSAKASQGFRRFAPSENKSVSSAATKNTLTSRIGTNPYNPHGS